jgi:ferric iron reductase protein FhuF
MHRSEWRSCSHENEVASFWHNGTGSTHPLWQQEEPTDGGQGRKCCLFHYRLCHASNRERECSEKKPREMAVDGLGR